MTVFTKTPPDLADAIWLNTPALRGVMKAIAQAGGEVRVAGGAVRNALLGVAIADIDLATTLLPNAVMTVCKAAGIRVHPTGIDHGTVTVVAEGLPFEVTTLRRDVETDGRRAVVAFTDDWRQDALRRDFTINAMYCDGNGKIYDYTTGYQDILRRRVRFVGDAERRISEDYLRILRFFRFHAAYGQGAMCPVGLVACAKLKAGLKSISAERIRQEMFKLLVAKRAVPTLKIMAAHGILKIILPYTEDWRVIERLPLDPVLRVFALASQKSRLKVRLRLSNDQATRIEALGQCPNLSPQLSPQRQHAALYKIGGQAWRDGVALAWAKSHAPRSSQKWIDLLTLPDRWAVPVFPIKGRDLLQQGVASSPMMGDKLLQLEKWWIAKDFAPTKAEILERVKK
ncbi:MAG: CCA tRNA nucleotidyltransferase [Alphaproteobacteria bacterium]|nr:CCA tRNA nucleotidyltransferase [Alphaproteobacteria bacterium]